MKLLALGREDSAGSAVGWIRLATTVVAVGLAAGWAVASLPPTLVLLLIGGTLAVTLWYQAPGLAVYALVAVCPFELSYSVAGIDGIGAQEGLLIALIVLVMALVASRSPRLVRLRTPLTRGLLLLWAFLLVWGAITFLLGPANEWLLTTPVRNAWQVYRDIGRSLLVFPLVLLCLDGRSSAERAIHILVMVGAGVALNAIWLARGSDGFATGHFSTGNALGGYLILVIPFAVAHVFSHGSVAIRLMHGLALALMIRAVWLAGSRGALVAVFAALAAMALFLPRRRVAAGAVLGLAALTVIVGMRGGLLNIPMVSRFIVLRDVREVDTLQWRQEQWSIFIQRIRDRPILGYGSDVDESLRDLDRARTAHNAFLALSVKSGLPAAVAWMVFLLLMGGLALRRALAPTPAEARVFWIGLVGFLAALIMHNMVESTLLTPPSQKVFWIVAASALVLRQSGNASIRIPSRTGS